MSRTTGQSANSANSQAAWGSCEPAAGAEATAASIDSAAIRSSWRSSPSEIESGGITTIEVTYYDVVGPDGQLAPFESFTLRRPRRD